MPYANNNGVRIHYEVEGDGPALVLQHGFTSCLKSWYVYGYVEALKKDHRLLIIDARGHGDSDKPHDPKEYELRVRVGDITAVLDDQTVGKVHYLGYSMGGVIGFGMARHVPQRLHSLTIGGMNPYGSGREPVEERVRVFSNGMEAYVTQSEAQDGPIDPERRAWLLANDPVALTAAIRAPMGLEGMDEVLPTMAMPCLLYVGEADGFYPGVKECVQHIPNATLATFPGLNHGQTSRASAVVLPHVTKFLKESSYRPARTG